MGMTIELKCSAIELHDAVRNMQDLVFKYIEGIPFLETIEGDAGAFLESQGWEQPALLTFQGLGISSSSKVLDRLKAAGYD